MEFMLAIIINNFLLYKIVVSSSSMYLTVAVKNQLFVTKVYDTSNINSRYTLVFSSDEFAQLLFF